MNDRNKRDGVTLSMNQDNFRVEHRTGGAHPRAQQGSVGGGLMLRMVSGMFRGLRLSQSTYREDT